MVSEKTKAIISTSLGIGFEWYDFFLYGLLATILAKYFFPSKVLILSLLFAYLVFFIGFLARPLGGIIFGYLGDKYGRIFPLYFTLLLAGLSSLVVALTPTYYQIGIWAPIILAAMRLLDGIGLGGEWGGSFSLTSEYISINRRGFYSGILQATVSIANLLISGLIILFTDIWGTSGFESIGWRVLFVIGFLVAIIAVFIRLRIRESPVFKKLQETGKIEKNPLVKAAKGYWHLLIAALFLVGVVNGVWYYVNYTLSIGYSVTLAKQFGYPSISLATVSLAILIVSIIGIFASPLFGLLSDKIGRRNQILADIAFGIVFAAPYFIMLRSGNPLLIITAITLFGLFVYYLAGAITPAVLVELFPPQVRYTGISLAYQVGVGFLGGSAPLLLTYLIGVTHNINVPIFYVIGTGIIALIMALIIGETRGRVYEGEEMLK
ncbi:MAG: MFS transporter [Vulcanisaeta sp. AZ3]|jgi:MHS family proline/betaine transporter-like MFS transporter|nr:MAG: MFS transporter [Vulcanisaeta sp. AZ3]